MANQKGLVHIYCGDGKGKTTASIGLAVRASGSGMKVLFAQLMKDGCSSELDVLKTINGIDVFETPCTDKFIFTMSKAEFKAYKECMQSCWSKLADIMNSGEYDIVLIDELCSAVSTGLLSAEEVSSGIKNRNEKVEVVITGREPDKKLIECADYISEIHKVKHPFDRGIPARQGIEQ